MKLLLFKIIFYVSLAFFVLALWQSNYLVVPLIYSTTALVVSLAFLVAGFLGTALNWQKILVQSGHMIGYGDCLAGMGLSVFAKYIPGKVWVIMGRAAYLSERRSVPLSTLSSLSLNAQLLTLWTGLVLGGLGLLFVGATPALGVAAILLWFVLTALVFTRVAQDVAQGLLKRLLTRQVRIPSLSFWEACKVTPWFIGTWSLWSIGFFFLAESLVPGHLPWTVGLAFPFAATLGIMALVFPGGLGVREGLLGAYLAFAGLSTQEAATIAVTSRLWFLVGEIFMFACAVITHRRIRPQEANMDGHIIIEKAAHRTKQITTPGQRGSDS